MYPFLRAHPVHLHGPWWRRNLLTLWLVLRKIWPTERRGMRRLLLEEVRVLVLCGEQLRELTEERGRESMFWGDPVVGWRLLSW